MRQIGSTMVILGVLAIVLNFVDRVPTLLVWIYAWGDTVAWIIKIAVIVIGAVLFFIGNPPEEPEVEPESEE